MSHIASLHILCGSPDLQNPDRTVETVLPQPRNKKTSQHPKWNWIVVLQCNLVFFSCLAASHQECLIKCHSQTDFVEHNVIGKYSHSHCEAVNCVLRLKLNVCIHIIFGILYFTHSFLFLSVSLHSHIFALLVRREPWRDPGLKTRVFSVNELKAYIFFSAIIRFTVYCAFVHVVFECNEYSSSGHETLWNWSSGSIGFKYFVILDGIN